MDILNIIENRHSVRSYKNVPVEKEKLDRVLRAAQMAPTAKNLQAFRIFVISTEKNKDSLQKIYPRNWFYEQSALCIACLPMTNNNCWIRKDGKNFGDVDSSIVMDHIILAATSEGLGTCWIGAFDAEAAIELLGLPDYLEPIVFTPLGYEEKPQFIKRRKNLDEIA